MITRQQQVVIVGAGIVGLSTAYALLAQGVKHVTVLELTVFHGYCALSMGLTYFIPKWSV